MGKTDNVLNTMIATILNTAFQNKLNEFFGDMVFAVATFFVAALGLATAFAIGYFVYRRVSSLGDDESSYSGSDYEGMGGKQNDDGSGENEREYDDEWDDRNG